MLTMNEPQVWMLIGVSAAAIFGMITIVSTLFVHVLKAEIGGLRIEIVRVGTGEQFSVEGRFG